MKFKWTTNNFFNPDRGEPPYNARFARHGKYGFYDSGTSTLIHVEIYLIKEKHDPKYLARVECAKTRDAGARTLLRTVHKKLKK